MDGVLPLEVHFFLKTDVMPSDQCLTDVTYIKMRRSSFSDTELGVF